METVNTNTNTASAPEPIVAAGGETVSFDDLDALMTTPKQQSKVDKELGVKGEKHESQEKGQQKAKEVKEGESEKESKSEKTKDSKSDKAKAKAFKFADEKGELDVLATAKIKVPVDGKEVDATLQDLINDYSGREHIKQKYDSFNKEKSQFTQDKIQLNNAVNTIYTKVQKGDVIGGIQDLAELLGGNGAKVVMELRQQLLGDIEKYKEMTPEDIARQQLELENKYYKEREERLSQEKSVQAERAQISTRLEAIQKEVGLDDEGFYNTYQEMVSLNPELKSQITPEAVGKYHKLMQKQTQLEQLLTDGSVDESVQQKAFTDLYDVWTKNPDLKLEDIKDIASQVYGSKASKALSRKIEKSKPVNTAKVSETRRRDPVNFDDLDD